MHLCAPHVCGAHKGQKRASDDLGVEFQGCKLCRVSAGNCAYVLYKGSQC